MLPATVEATAMGHDSPTEDLRLFQTGGHACGYWPERSARDLVLDPRDPRLAQIYPQALDWGFRRSGDLVYRPHCAHCRACVAVRIPVAEFVPDRSQRRCLGAQRRPADPDRAGTAQQRAFRPLPALLAARHRDGGMDGHGTAEFDQFLVGSWSDTRFVEMRESSDHGPGRLLAVAVTDRVGSGLSAVYTFYDPELAQRGLGTLAILRQIEWARREGLEHLYLGYWIEGHAKMDYKRRFQPLEAFDGQRWRRFAG